MSKRSTVAVAVVVCVVLAGLPAARLAARPPALCLAVGDSLAAGIGSTLPRERGAAALLCRWSESYFAERAELVTVARPGERTSTFATSGQLEALREAVERGRRAGQPIRFVLVSLGGNDLLALRAASERERDREFAAFAQDIQAALAAIREAVGDAPVLVLTLYDPTEGDSAAERSDSWWIARFDEELRRAAEAIGATVVDLAGPFRGEIAEWTWWPVDVHPTNAGYEAIARLAWRAIGWDREPPQVRVERPADGTALDRRYVTVRAQVADPGGIETVTLWVDGNEIGTLVPLQSGDAWITLWETPWPSAGPPIVLEVRARDRAGNEGLSLIHI
ncbi:MAG: GDSL-type esterase/lipase family protein, partial [Thermomicrobium sp.]|nr:GDSL-type esterase/lipase family protein [Thermomicrobium sp.]